MAEAVIVGDQGLNGHGQGARQPGQQGHRHTTAADLIGGELRLGNAQALGQLDLCQIGILASLGDAGAEGLKEGAFVRSHGQAQRVRDRNGSASHQPNSPFTERR